MAYLLDSSIWIDLSRSRSPATLKSFILPYVMNPQACVAQPIIFEVLRNASSVETRQLNEYFDAIHTLPNTGNLWIHGVELGRRCRRIGANVNSLDLLIAVVAIHHGAELVTFDHHFQAISKVSDLKLRFLNRPLPYSPTN